MVSSHGRGHAGEGQWDRHRGDSLQAPPQIPRKHSFLAAGANKSKWAAISRSRARELGPLDSISEMPVLKLGIQLVSGDLFLYLVSQGVRG